MRTLEDIAQPWRLRVVAILEGLSFDYAPELGDTLRYEPNLVEDGVAAGRCFVTRAPALARNPRTFGPGREHFKDLDVIVIYPPHYDAEMLEDVIHRDYTAIEGALTDPTKWEGATSGIVSLASANDEILPASIEEIEREDGSRSLALTIRVALTHRVLP